MITVKSVQERLSKAGLYNGKIDGDWGPITMNAFLWECRHKGLYIPKRLEIAAGDLFTRETPGEKTTARIAVYHSHTDLKATSDEVAWCSSAMCCWTEEAGEKSTRSAAARSWAEWGERQFVPQPGSIAVLTRGTGWQGHVTLYLEGDKDSFLGLGGNQSNMVNVQAFLLSKLISFRK